MILLVSNTRDITTDFVVRELDRRGAQFIRLNTDRIELAGLSFEVRSDGRATWWFSVGDRTFGEKDFSAGYFRRPALPDAASAVASAYVEYVAGEWTVFLNSFYRALTCRWLNAPAAILLAEDKPRQLAAAARQGFKVPRTLASTDFGRVQSFMHDVQDGVAKPIKSGIIAKGEQEKIAFTTRVTKFGLDAEPAVRSCPVVYQEELQQSVDIRVTVVGTRVFACEIVGKSSVVDWRVVPPDQLGYRFHELPKSVVVSCIALTEELGLQFGAIDLLLTPDREYWFLEINPNGQWAWIEARAGLPIASAIADNLCEAA